MSQSRRPRAFPTQLHTTSIRELRADPSLAPGGGAFVSVLNAFLPMVLRHGAEARPGKSSFRRPNRNGCLRMPRGQVEAVAENGRWSAHGFFFATKSVAVRERRHLRQRRPVGGSSAAEHLELFKRLSLIRPKLRKRARFAKSFYASHPRNRPLRCKTKPARVEKDTEKAFARVRRKMRKTNLGTNLSLAFESLHTQVPEEVSGPIIDRLSRWTPKVPRTDLTRSTLTGWRWLALRLFFKRVSGWHRRGGRCPACFGRHPSLIWPFTGI